MDVGRENGNFGTILLDGGLYALVELGDDFTQSLNTIPNKHATDDQLENNIQAIKELLEGNRQYFADFLGIEAPEGSGSSEEGSGLDEESSGETTSKRRRRRDTQMSIDEKLDLVTGRQFKRLIVMFTRPNLSEYLLSKTTELEITPYDSVLNIEIGMCDPDEPIKWIDDPSLVTLGFRSFRNLLKNKDAIVGVANDILRQKNATIPDAFKQCTGPEQQADIAPKQVRISRKKLATTTSTTLLTTTAKLLSTTTTKIAKFALEKPVSVFFEVNDILEAVPVNETQDEEPKKRVRREVEDFLEVMAEYADDNGLKVNIFDSAFNKLTTKTLGSMEDALDFFKELEDYQPPSRKGKLDFNE